MLCLIFIHIIYIPIYLCYIHATCNWIVCTKSGKWAVCYIPPHVIGLSVPSQENERCVIYHHMALDCLYQVRKVSGVLYTATCHWIVFTKSGKWAVCYIPPHVIGLTVPSQESERVLYTTTCHWIVCTKSGKLAVCYIPPHVTGLSVPSQESERCVIYHHMSLDCLYQVRKVSGMLYTATCHWIVCAKSGKWAVCYIPPHVIGLSVPSQESERCVIYRHMSLDCLYQVRNVSGVLYTATCHWIVCTKSGKWAVCYIPPHVIGLSVPSQESERCVIYRHMSLNCLYQVRKVSGVLYTATCHSIVYTKSGKWAVCYIPPHVIGLSVPSQESERCVIYRHIRKVSGVLYTVTCHWIVCTKSGKWAVCYIPPHVIGLSVPSQESERCVIYHHMSLDCLYQVRKMSGVLYTATCHWIVCTKSGKWAVCYIPSHVIGLSVPSQESERCVIYHHMSLDCLYQVRKVSGHISICYVRDNELAFVSTIITIPTVWRLLFLILIPQIYLYYIESYLFVLYMYIYIILGNPFKYITVDTMTWLTAI